MQISKLKMTEQNTKLNNLKIVILHFDFLTLN